MRAIAIDGVAWSVCVSVCLCVCLLVTFVSPAKTAEPIEMPVGGLTVPKEALDGVQIHQGKGQFWGLSGPLKSRRVSEVSCAKTAEPTEVPLRGEGDWLLWAQRTMY